MCCCAFVACDLLGVIALYMMRKGHSKEFRDVSVSDSLVGFVCVCVRIKCFDVTDAVSISSATQHIIYLRGSIEVARCCCDGTLSQRTTHS